MPAKKKTTTKKASTKKEPEVVSDGRIFKVFFNELTPTGRDGATAHKVFTNKKDADTFAESVDGRVV